MATSGFRFPPEILTAFQLAGVGRAGLTQQIGNGLCEVVSNAVFTDIWEPGGVRPWLQAAERLRIFSDNANDTAAGSGAQAVLLEGLNVNGARIVETLPTAGLSVSALTTLQFFRLNQALVRPVGTYGGSNEGRLSIETETSILQATIPPDFGRSTHCHVTIPRDQIGLLFGIFPGIDANKTAVIRLHVRTDAGNIVPPFFPIQRVFTVPGLLGFIPIASPIPAPIPPFSDLWIAALGDSPMTTIGVTFSLLFVPL